MCELHTVGNNPLTYKLLLWYRESCSVLFLQFSTVKKYCFEGLRQTSGIIGLKVEKVFNEFR